MHVPKTMEVTCVDALRTLNNIFEIYSNKHIYFETAAAAHILLCLFYELSFRKHSTLDENRKKNHLT